MKNYFVSYHFSAPGNVTGFGDYSFEANAIRDMTDIVAVKELIKAFLAEKGMHSVTIVILSWQAFEVDS